MDLKRADDSERGLGEGVSCGYFLVPVINQEMALTHGQELKTTMIKAMSMRVNTM